MKKVWRTMASRIAVFIILDILSVAVSSYMAIYMRFDFKFASITPVYMDNLQVIVLFDIFTTVLIFFIWKLYKSVWRYASVNELINIAGATATCSISQILFCEQFNKSMPRGYYVLYTFGIFGLACCTRFGYRILRIINDKRMNYFHAKKQIKTMIIGAGAAGNAILKEIESSNYVNMHVKCIVDDNPNCNGKVMRGVPIVGGREKILPSVMEYGIDEIIFAIPSANMQTRTEILDICKESGCKLRILPGMYQLINGEVGISKLREVQIEDLLGREPIMVNIDEIVSCVKNKVVLITGGGGSIGSELCRQIATYGPRQLIILDIYENNAYDIQQELKRKHPGLNLEVLIASVRNTHRIETIFEEYRPDIVYHAAAHKHVPLMEDSPNEAIKNNVFGTYKTAQAAGRYGTKKFVLISTDKAVNPTNIMGASKRLCEMVIQYLNERSATEFVAVRFGNVLGSNGSVIPLFKRQIAEGGPVTVTDPGIVRYFMTIPEAVSLVLQAGAYAKGGEIFVLDMGKPVKIDDLAKNLIKLSGYKLGEDIKIEYTGLRPGEKMYEELLMDEEGLKKTTNSMIFIGKPIEYNEEVFAEELEKLMEAATEDSSDIRSLVKEMVPTYQYTAEK